MMGIEDQGAVRNDAFHITAATNMALIAVHGFRADRRGVLGTGAYFDLGNEATGWGPARRRYPAPPLVVVRCDIEMGRILDLADAPVRARFRQFQRGLPQRVGREEGLRLS